MEATAMDPTAVFIRRILFPAWVRKNKSARLVYAAELEKTQFLSPAALDELQWRRFKAVLEHAFDRSAFYRRKLTAAGISPADVRTRADLRLIPPTTKTEIQESLQDLIADGYQPLTLIKDMTGGSTGSPMVFYYNEETRDRREAGTIRHDRWTGWDIGEKKALVWGAPRDVAGGSRVGRMRDNLLGRMLTLDASALDEARMRAFCDKLQQYQPAFVLAYANTMALFARFVRDAEINPVRPRAIICSGEVLTEESRQLIEETFGCPVFNRYGSREFSVIASECPAHSGMHVNAEGLLLEVVGRDGSATQDEGEIIVTDLRNYAMPFIRYRTKDVGSFRSGVCACGRGLPRIDLSGGRVTDFLTATSGAKVSGIVLATYGITNIRGIRQVQFVQHRRGAVTARIARGTQWTDESLRLLTERIRGLLGDEMIVETEFVDHIPLEASGKYRFSVSQLAG